MADVSVVLTVTRSEVLTEKVWTQLQNLQLGLWFWSKVVFIKGSFLKQTKNDLKLKYSDPIDPFDLQPESKVLIRSNISSSEIWSRTVCSKCLVLIQTDSFEPAAVLMGPVLVTGSLNPLDQKNLKFPTVGETLEHTSA